MHPVFSAAALATIILATSAHAGSLAEAKGRSRPVVVLSDARDDPRTAKQISALDGTGPELSKRDIKVLQESGVSGPLHKALGLQKKGFAVVLVGKDGTVKKVWKDPVDPKDIFTVIDAMPMRRDEMNG